MKYVPWYIAGALAIALVIVLLSQCNPDRPEIGYIKDSTQYWKNKFGQTFASLKQREADFSVVQHGYLDSIAKLHNTKAGNIKEAVQVVEHGNTEIKGQGKPTIVYDTVRGKPIFQSMSQIFLSPYYLASVTLAPGYDSSVISLQTFDTLHLLVKEVREGSVFNRRAYYQIDVNNANPFNVVEKIHAYRVPAPRAKKFGIGIMAGYGFGGATIKPAVWVGVGVSYNLIRF